MANTFLAATATEATSEILRTGGLTMIQVNTTSAQQRFVLQQARGELSDTELAHADNAAEWADMTARSDAEAFSATRRVRQFYLSTGFAYRLLRYQGAAGATASWSRIATWVRRPPGTHL